ncbi:MAG: regulatory iron-sulfur-containing complex subunit RicT [candidate division WOR-3 bacterium]
MSQNYINEKDISCYEVKINPFRTELVLTSPNENNEVFNLNDWVIIAFYKEILLGEVIRKIPYSQTTIYGKILRKATEDDFCQQSVLKKEAEELHTIIEPIVKNIEPSAKIVLVDKSFNRYKAYCYLIAEKRVDYAKLHKMLTNILGNRIIIKQIGVRDYTRSLGGIGVCGREICCRIFLGTLKSITLSMARQQNIYVEPEKISGVCGKLRCCLAFEFNSEQEEILPDEKIN